ncbi:hypothetical protein FALBO_5398 [Fusarium albosuccineum]|uniref:Uncharacterized protein n=1 Tax=Fusarium albosuccineum TaxID=1237068 RepID=A0A8H4LFB3_9HYPO|nr:hypothetical protein FALBO_5398 [Fusarium albosuccineum]
MNSGAPSLTPVAMTFPSNDFFILQPLFRAVVIVLLAKDYHIRVADIGQLPVLVVLTGIEDGLSAPLSLEPLRDNVDRVISDKAVQVPLGVAVDFVVALEQREVAAFGPQPDPVESTKNMQDGCSFSLDSYPRAMKKLGWGDEPITGPSSTWVDDEKYPEWSGDGAIDDKNCYAQMEKTYRWFLLCAMAGISTVPANLRPGRRRQSI